MAMPLVMYVELTNTQLLTPPSDFHQTQRLDFDQTRITGIKGEDKVPIDIEPCMLDNHF